MTTTTRTTKAGTVRRMISIGEAVNGLLAASVSETRGAGHTCDVYYLRRQAADFGVAFTVEKSHGDTYDVLLNVPGGGHSCDCAWGSYKSHIKNCRHVDLCLQAVREGKI